MPEKSLKHHLTVIFCEGWHLEKGASVAKSVETIGMVKVCTSVEHRRAP